MNSERRAIALLLLLGIAGAAVRLATHSDGPPGALGYRAAGSGSRAPMDSVAARAGRLARPLRRGETIDLDRASGEEIARLPRVGPGLAARIVAHRDLHGPFGSLEGLDRVNGVGPSVLEAVTPYAIFSGRTGGSADGRIAKTGTRRSADPPPRRSAGLVSLNTATAHELDQLPGIGPARAKAIVEDRSRRGPYQSLDDLRRVAGLRPATIMGLKGRVKVP
jgi:competence ComEA-like helix-hairpin-helix protein